VAEGDLVGEWVVCEDALFDILHFDDHLLDVGFVGGVVLGALGDIVFP
jgi:hypothetical protein